MKDIKLIYLDYNATTPIAEEVAETMAPFLYGHFGNPSSSHPYGAKAKLAVERPGSRLPKQLTVNPVKSFSPAATPRATYQTGRTLRYLGVKS